MTEHSVTWVLYVLVTISLLLSHIHGVCIFGPGPDCAFPCRCSDSISGTSGGLCDSATGVCGTGSCKSVARNTTHIGQAWSGDGCQTGNVALGKSATVVNGAPAAAEKAVDGFTGVSSPGSHCISIDTQDSNVAVWWEVDLGSVYNISTVTVFNIDSTESTNLEKFYIKQGNKPNHATHTGCTTQHDPVPAGGSVTHKCPVTARYISINKFEQAKSKMTLCEVVVTGHKYYNVDCSKCTSGKCHQDLWCEKCNTGWMEPDCRNATPSSCPDNCNCPSNNICDTCHMWYIPDSTCDKNIPSVGVNSQNNPALSSPTDTSLTVKYKQTDLSTVHADVHQYYFYIVKYKRAGDSNYIQISNQSHISNTVDRLVNITGLQSDTTYAVVLDVYRNYAPKGWSQILKELPPVSIKTLCSSPGKPSGVTAVHVPSGIKLSWNGIGYPPCNVPSQIEMSINNVLYSLYAGFPPSTDRSYTQIFTQFITPDTHTVFIKVTYRDRTVIKSDSITVTVPASPTSPTTTTTSLPTTTGSTVKSSTTVPSKTPGTTTQKTNNTHPSKPTPNNGKNKGTDVGMIAGVVVGMIVLIALVVVGVLVYLKKFRNSEDGEFRSKKPLIYVPHRMEEGNETTFENSAYEADKSDNEILKPAAPHKSTATAMLPPATTIASTSDGRPVAQVSPIKQLREHREKLDEVYGNVHQPVTRVNVNEFESYIQNNSPVELSPTGANMAFSKEYKRIPVGMKAKADTAGKATVKEKNRYLNIHAYDHTRVVLDVINDDEDSDYINANYITGYKDRERAYVATQGPKKESVADFWRMIWIVNTNRIVMITKVVENGKRKSEVYWPEVVGGVKTYSYITVTNISVEIFADYTIRVFSVQKEGENETRMIRHLHFTSWTDKSIPEQKFPLIAFRRKVRALDDPSKGPMVVHCSAGIGRTGTFVALDYLLDEAADTQSVDVFEYVCLMRTQRMNMVQTMQQYQFIYYALLDSFRAGTTAIPCERFESEYRELKDNTHKLQQQFDSLAELTQSNDVNPMSQTGYKEENQSKNRFQDIIPADKSRPFLSRCEGNHNDYINAAFVVGFKKRYSCIATQMPLEDTVVDLWRLMWDHSSKTIVMLNQIDPNNSSEEVNGAIYWPDDDSSVQEYGPIQVELHSQDSTDTNVSTRQFKVKNKLKPKEDSVIVQQFQFNSWPSDDQFPSSTGDFVNLLETVEKWQQSSGNGPVIVHCMNGCSRSGLYCAASYLIDRLKEEQEVDPFLATRFVRLNRPQFITDLDQYKYLYDIAAAYMSDYDMYANFK